MSTDNSRWFAVRSIWRHDPPAGTPNRHTYEERIVFYIANDFDDAIAKSECDASDYDGECIGYHMAFEMGNRPLGSGDELFSLMRDSDFAPDEYLDRFHDTGTERTQISDSK